MTVEPDRRWPSSVYGSGQEPDPRFTLANERTMLAWVRTALALVGAGVLIDAVEIDVSETTRAIIGAVLVVLGGVAAAGAWFRWASTERALRHTKALPGARLAAVVIGGLVLVAIAVLVMSAVS